MPSSDSRPVTIAVNQGIHVSGLLQAPPRARACYVLAHGAGAGMAHPFMAAVAAELGERGIATLRYQFPYMEKGGRRPDPPKLAHATVRAAVAEALRLMPDLPLVAGGKSFGGRGHELVQGPGEPMGDLELRGSRPTQHDQQGRADRGKTNAGKRHGNSVRCRGIRHDPCVARC